MGFNTVDLHGICQVTWPTVLSVKVVGVSQETVAMPLRGGLPAETYFWTMFLAIPSPFAISPMRVSF